MSLPGEIPPAVGAGGGTGTDDVTIYIPPLHHYLVRRIAARNSTKAVRINILIVDELGKTDTYVVESGLQTTPNEYIIAKFDPPIELGGPRHRIVARFVGADAADVLELNALAVTVRED